MRASTPAAAAAFRALLPGESLGDALGCEITELFTGLFRAANDEHPGLNFIARVVFVGEHD